MIKNIFHVEISSKEQKKNNWRIRYNMKNCQKTLDEMLKVKFSFRNLKENFQCMSMLG